MSRAVLVLAAAVALYARALFIYGHAHDHRAPLSRPCGGDL